MKTIVVFRRFKDEGDVIALFPEIAADHLGMYCESYQNVGQHSGADYSGCIAMSKPAAPSEYMALAKELQRIGYDLDIRQRATAAMSSARRKG